MTTQHGSLFIRGFGGDAAQQRALALSRRIAGQLLTADECSPQQRAALGLGLWHRDHRGIEITHIVVGSRSRANRRAKR